MNKSDAINLLRKIVLKSVYNEDSGSFTLYLTDAPIMAKRVKYPHSFEVPFDKNDPLTKKYLKKLNLEKSKFALQRYNLMHNLIEARKSDTAWTVHKVFIGMGIAINADDVYLVLRDIKSFTDEIMNNNFSHIRRISCLTKVARL